MSDDGHNFWRNWNLGYPTPPAQLQPSPALAEAKTTEAMRERLAREGAALVAHLPTAPEPAPERPEWVRITDRAFGLVREAHKPGDIVKVAERRVSDGFPRIPTLPGRLTTLQPKEWEPADPPTPEPPSMPDDEGPCMRCADPDCSPPESCLEAEAAAAVAMWTVGDWFTITERRGISLADHPYRVAFVFDNVTTVLGFDTDDGYGYQIEADRCTRCDPPSDPQPDELVAVMLPRSDVNGWSRNAKATTATFALNRLTVACAVALSQEGGQA